MLDITYIKAFVVTSKEFSDIAGQVARLSGVQITDELTGWDEVVQDVADILTAALELYNAEGMQYSISYNKLCDAIKKFEG